MKLLAGKKGDISSFAEDLISFGAFNLILIISFILFSVFLGGCSDLKITQGTYVSNAAEDLNEEMILHNFLREKVAYYGREITMAELISLTYSDGRLDNIEQPTLDFFAELDEATGGGVLCSILCLQRGDDDLQAIYTYTCPYDILDRCGDAATVLPLYGQQEGVVVKLNYDVDRLVGS
jgi:hypothetical protein